MLSRILIPDNYFWLVAITCLCLSAFQGAVYCYGFQSIEKYFSFATATCIYQLILILLAMTLVPFFSLFGDIDFVLFIYLLTAILLAYVYYQMEYFLIRKISLNANKISQKALHPLLNETHPLLSTVIKTAQLKSPVIIFLPFITVAVLEEIIFRGDLVLLFSNLFTLHPLSSLICINFFFAASHAGLGLFHVVLKFIFGFIAIMLMDISSNILVPIFFHAAFNFFILSVWLGEGKNA